MPKKENLHRLTLEVPHGTISMIDQIKEAMELPSRKMVIQRALIYYQLLMLEVATGGKIILEKNGQQEALRGWEMPPNTQKLMDEARAKIISRKQTSTDAK